MDKENPKAIMQTATGGHFNFEDPLSSDINVLDIAHALSHIPRFAGHTQTFYSVAEHSHMCVEYLRRMVEESDGQLKISNQTYMAALLHDAAEAFISDIPRPFKNLIPGIAKMELSILDAIIQLLEIDLDEADWDLVKQADNYMLMLEARHLLAPARQFKLVWGPWIGKHYQAHNEMVHDEGSGGELWFSNFSHAQATQVFLDEFNKIKWSRV